MSKPPVPLPSGAWEQQLSLVVPPLIVVLVVLAEVVITGLLPAGPTQLWGHLLIYGVVGPFVTSWALSWIAAGSRARLQAEIKMREMYEDLQRSHAQLSHSQTLMRELSTASDLTSVMEVGTRGAHRIASAEAARLELFGGLQASSGHWPTNFPVQCVVHADLDGGGRLSLLHHEAVTEDDQALAFSLAAELDRAIKNAWRRTQDLMTLHSVDDSIRAERNMRRLLLRVAVAMSERAGATHHWVFLCDEDGVFRPDTDVGGSEKAPAAVPSFALRAAELGEPLRLAVGEVNAAWPEMSDALCFPMRDDVGLVGVIVLAHEDAAAFEAASMPLLALMASQAALGVRNARAYLYSEERAINEERTRIAREIHDGVAQSLAFCAIQLDLAGKNLERDPDKAAAEIKNASALLREQIQEVRRSIFALRPINLERFGLIDTLRLYVQDFGEQNKIGAHFISEGEISLSKGDEAVFFRIAQESLNNVAKHSHASSVTVRLRGGLREVQLTVQDDGIGFDPWQIGGRVSSAGGLGLVQMHERLSTRGGEYSVRSAPGEGCTVSAVLPQL